MVSRLEFLRGNWQAEKPVRPPWIKNETTLLENCDFCNACFEACDNKIIIKGSGDYPQIDFSHGECTFCQQCATACKKNIFNVNLNSPWNLQLNIKQSCIALNNVVCRSCAEQCDYDALSFKLVVGGAAIPQINPSLCDGCGACVRVCPNNSIELTNT